MTKIRTGITLLLLLIAVALFVPYFSPYSATDMSFTETLQPPSLKHPFGTDQFGRDVLTRLATGLRISLLYAIAAVGTATLLGTAFGALSGYAGGWLDAIVMRPLEVLMAFPVVLLAITVIASLGTGAVALLISVIAVYTPIVARVARASVIQISGLEYVQAAVALGSSRQRVLIRYVLPNAIDPILVQSTALIGLAILLEAGLSFLGLGIQPPAPSLGLMLAEGRDFMVDHPWVVALPGAAIVLTVMGFNLIGSGYGTRLTGTP